MNNAIQPLPSDHIASTLGQSIDHFDPRMAGYLRALGLPTDFIFAAPQERLRIIKGLEDAVSAIDGPKRASSLYLTKFAVAISVGLFDAALNYLWDETIRSLRQLVVDFDIQYFFSVAEQVSPKHSNLKDVDDLSAVGDHDLLESCRRIGLIDDIVFKRLEHTNYMRNHASAAHPNAKESLIKTL